MKKSSKVLGSVALSAALVMGTAVPAFAATETLSETDKTKNQQEADKVGEGAEHEMNANGSGKAINGTSMQGVGDIEAAGTSTVVNVATYTSQISVTIPLSLPLMLDTAGGEGYAPQDGKYFILNNSSIDVEITAADYKVAVAQKDNWTFGPEAGYASAGQNAQRITSSSSPAIGSMWAKLQPYEMKVPDGESEEKKTNVGTALILKGTSSAPQSGTQSALGWVVPAKSDTDTPEAIADGSSKNRLAVDVDANSSKLASQVATSTTAAGIIYTVGKAS